MNNPNYTVGTGIGELYAARRPSLMDNTSLIAGYQDLRKLPDLLSVNINGVRLSSPLSSINKKLSSSRRAANNIWRGGLSTCLFKKQARFWIASSFLPAVCGFAPPSPMFIFSNMMSIELTLNFIRKGGKKANSTAMRGLLSFTGNFGGNSATGFPRSDLRDTPELPFTTNKGCKK